VPARSVRTRIFALESLENVALTSPEVHNTLVALLKETNPPNLEEQVVRTLKARKDTASAPALRDLAAKTTNTDVRDAAKDAAEALEAK